MSNGSVECWGGNSYGELGLGSTSQQVLTPTKVPGISGAVAVVAGITNSCAIVAGGVVECWGRNNFGQLGIGSISDFVDTPTPVPGIAHATSVSLTQNFACASLADGTVECWGQNWAGNLGNSTVPIGQTSIADSPVAVDGLTDAVSVTVAQSYSTPYVCAIESTGGVTCWGDNQVGELGNSTLPTGPGALSQQAVEVTGLDGPVSSIALGAGANCALLTSAKVQCWAGNNWGQLGQGTMGGFSSTPLDVPGFSNVTSIRAGAGSVCVVNSGAVSCWGYNGLGALGNGNGGQLYSLTPTAVVGLPGPVGSVSGSQSTTCALLHDRSLYCWGFNGSTFGVTEESLTASATPVKIPGI